MYICKKLTDKLNSVTRENLTGIRVVRAFNAEKFQQDWEAYQLRQKNRYTLVVDDDFQSIYSQHKCSGNFGSCMTGKKCFNFYSESVVAKSAKLLDAEAGNLIVARCVLYPEAVNAKGKVVRYADRQYSSNGADRLKNARETILGKNVDSFEQINKEAATTKY